jgi:hypothetical protein
VGNTYSGFIDLKKPIGLIPTPVGNTHAGGLNISKSTSFLKRWDDKFCVQKIVQKEKEELEKPLVEGYRAAAEESLAMTKEFESADLEGWDDY